MIPNRPWAVLFLLVGIGLHWAAAGVAQAQTTPAQVEGRQVTAIRIVDQSGEVLGENVSGLPLRRNQPFTLDAERASPSHERARGFAGGLCCPAKLLHQRCQS
jgi:hypothetical protein